MSKIPKLYLILGGIALIAILSLGWFVGFSRVWNGIGNALFRRQINAERAKVQKELDDAAKGKKAFEQTLVELKQSKDELVKLKAEKDRLEQIFNDKSRTAQEKVAAFKAAVADDPVSTPTDGVTVDALCQRARSTGASAATIAALCG